MELKKISKEGIPRAIKKIEWYRLLNEPTEAESICRDIIALDPDNQEAIVMLILCLTDQFNQGVGGKEARQLLPQVKDQFRKEYYRGIILERQAKAALDKGIPGSGHDAYEWLEAAMESFEKADALSAGDDDSAILRYNSCVRIIQKHTLTPRPPEQHGLHLPLE